MIREFVEHWEKNKDNLRDYLKTHPQEGYGEYKDLVKLLFDHVINPEREKPSYWHYNSAYNTDNILVIDDGDYQGTLIFILHENAYQPGVAEYVYTHVYYGSCSGCDTLLGISSYSSDLPTDEQVEDYMELCLHLLQHCKRMVDEED